MLNTQQYKVYIKGKMEQSKERSSALYLGVVTIEKGAFWLPLTTVANLRTNALPAIPLKLIVT